MIEEEKSKPEGRRKKQTERKMVPPVNNKPRQKPNTPQNSRDGEWWFRHQDKRTVHRGRHADVFPTKTYPVEVSPWKNCDLFFAVYY